MKHKHAEIMFMYALDAHEADKPWERWEGGFGRNNDQITPLSFHDDKLYRRKADAPPVPWHLLDRYVRKNAVTPQFNPQESVECNPHPDAPHGFCRNASHSYGRYVCECEFWEPDDVVFHKSTDMSHKQPTPVDLSVLIDSGIDCLVTFSSDGYVHILSLDWNVDRLVRNRVKPKMNYWFCSLQFDGDWDIVTRLTNAGFEVEDKWDDHYREWIGFRIIGLQDNYCWPWEIEE